jgi:ribonuclease P protein component
VEKTPGFGSCQGSFTFPRQERLKRRDEIREVFSRRKAVSCDGAKLLRRENGLSFNRAAFTFSRKFGSAVERNRSRRVSREAYRHFRGQLRPGFDLVVLVYPGKDDFCTRIIQFKELFRKAGLFKDPGIQEKIE